MTPFLPARTRRLSLSIARGAYPAGRVPDVAKRGAVELAWKLKDVRMAAWAYGTSEATIQRWRERLGLEGLRLRRRPEQEAA